jgi:hypothetical protein
MRFRRSETRLDRTWQVKIDAAGGLVAARSLKS